MSAVKECSIRVVTMASQGRFGAFKGVEALENIFFKIFVIQILLIVFKSIWSFFINAIFKILVYPQM